MKGHSMRSVSSLLLLLMSGLFVGSPAKAGIFADDLSRCVVTQATSEDQKTLIRWIFSAMATNPALDGLATISDQQRAAHDKAFAALTDRLLLSDCRPQLLLAIKNEGGNVIEQAFRVLGETAMRGVMGSKEAQAAISAFGAQMDEARWSAFRREAGLLEPAKPAAKP
jgi:hypothetical protein